EPPLLVTPLFTVTCRVAPPHAAGRPETATLTTVARARLSSTLSPAAVQRGTVIVDAPRESDEVAAEAADPITAQARVRIPSPTARRHMTAGLQWAGDLAAAGRLAEWLAADHHADARHRGSGNSGRERGREAGARRGGGPGGLTEGGIARRREGDLVGLAVAGRGQAGDRDRPDGVARRRG